MKKRIDKGKDELAKYFLTYNLQSRSVWPSEVLNSGAKDYAERATNEAIEYAKSIPYSLS